MWAFNGSYSPPEEVGPPNQFSSKFGPAPLPAIQSQTPQPTDDNQIVPYGRSRSRLSSQITNMQPTGEFSDNRLRALESRLSVAEQSNRALLEEVVRLQGELKQSHRLTEETIQTERQARQQLTDNIRSSNDLIGQLGARLKRAEEKVSDERTAVGALVNHTKQVEQAVIGSQQELMAKRDQQISKITALQNELDESNRLREQLERTTTTLIDEVRQMKGRMDAAGVEFNSVLHDIKDKTKRIEDEQRAAIDQQRKIHESQSTSGQATSVLRTQLDARLGEVRDVLMDLRNRITTEESERRQMEQTAQIKLNDLQSQIHEQVRKRDETMHALGLAQREREHAADNERLKMQGKIAEIAEEVSRKILSKEIRLREEAQQKFSNIEKYLHAEQAARIAHEQAMREENEKRWAALQKLTEEEVLHVREGQKLDRHKSIGSINKVSEMMQTLEKQQAETKKQLEQVMKAEIKSRQSQDKQIEDKIEDVQEKLGVAISTLQQAIGGINDQVNATTNEPNRKRRRQARRAAKAAKEGTVVGSNKSKQKESRRGHKKKLGKHTGQSSNQNSDKSGKKSQPKKQSQDAPIPPSHNAPRPLSHNAPRPPSHNAPRPLSHNASANQSTTNKMSSKDVINESLRQSLATQHPPSQLHIAMHDDTITNNAVPAPPTTQARRSSVEAAVSDTNTKHPNATNTSTNHLDTEDKPDNDPSQPIDTEAAKIDPESSVNASKMVPSADPSTNKDDLNGTNNPDTTDKADLSDEITKDNDGNGNDQKVEVRDSPDLQNDPHPDCDMMDSEDEAETSELSDSEDDSDWDSDDDDEGSQGILKAMIEERSSGSLRGLADLDSRLMALQAKVSSQEEELTTKFTETLAIALDEKDEKITKAAMDAQQEQIDALNDWQDSAEKKLKHIKERMDELGPQIREMNRTNESLQDNMKGLVDTESKDRIRDVQMVRQDLETKYRQLTVEIANAAKTAKPTAVPDIPVTQKEKLAQGKIGKGGKLDEATKEKIEILDEEFHKQRRKHEELKEQVSKIETSVQTVRVHLARKIDAETRSRREEIHDLQAVFEDLHAKVDPSSAKKQEENKPKGNESTISPKKDDRSSAKGKSSAKSSPSKGNAKGTPKKSPKNDEKGDSPKKDGKEDNKNSKNEGKADKKSPENSGKSEGQGGSKDDSSGRTGGDKDGGQRSQGGDGR